MLLNIIIEIQLYIKKFRLLHNIKYWRLKQKLITKNIKIKSNTNYKQKKKKQNLKIYPYIKYKSYIIKGNDNISENSFIDKRFFLILL